MRQLTFDSYVIETLLPDLVGHDRTPSAFLVYLILWNEAGGREGAAVALSLRTIAERIGMSKRTVQNAVAVLTRRRLVTVQQASTTAVPRYTVLRPWRRR